MLKFFYIVNFVSNIVNISSSLVSNFVFFLKDQIRSSYRRCSVKKVYLKISQISQENTCVGVSFFSGLRPATLLKRDSKQVFSCEIYHILTNTYYEEHLWTTASVRCFISSYLLRRGHVVFLYPLFKIFFDTDDSAKLKYSSSCFA